MSRVAIVRDSDLAVRAPDGAIRDPDVEALRAAVVAAGHDVVELAACEVVVVALTPGSRGLADRQLPDDLRVVAVIERDSELAAEADRSSLETRADAFALGPRRIPEAIAWVTLEDRAARATGAPRLVVIGSITDDYGMVRAIPAEPMILGRAMSFSQHPQRPDRMPTPVGSIARWHARVRNVDGALAIADLASTNGTLVIRDGQPARLLCPQQAGGGRGFGPPAAAWLIRDPAVEGALGAWSPLQIGDQVQLPGFWRFRVDGDAGWRADD